jgi:hypothetical protein
MRMSDRHHDEEQLRQRLAAFVTKRQIEVPSDDLIEIGNAILREDWNSRWPKRPRWLANRLHGNTSRASDDFPLSSLSASSMLRATQETRLMLSGRMR